MNYDIYIKMLLVISYFEFIKYNKIIDSYSHWTKNEGGKDNEKFQNEYVSDLCGMLNIYV